MTKAKVTDFKQHKANANKGSERGEYMIETSLREVGAWRSVGADRNGTIGVGNKTTQKWQEIANPDDVIVVPTDGTKLVIVQRTDLDFDSDDPAVVERTIKAAYFDNRASEVSMTWDAEQVLADITAGVDLDAMFRHDELDELLKDLLPKTEGDAEPQIDRAAELNEVWQVRTGDVWAIGDHRLVCGDCTDPAVVAKVMQEEKADAVVTDPPYGYDKGIEADETIGAAITVYSACMPLCYQAVTDDAWAIVDTPKKYISEFINASESSGWKTREPVLHMYRNSMANGVYGTNIFELSFVYSKGKPKVNHRNLNGVDVSRKAGHDNIHPTQKFSQSYQHFIKLFTGDGSVIFDPFLGSGTTLVACQNLGRRGRGCEISPNYCAVILQRMQDAFGLVGVRIDSQVNT